MIRRRMCECTITEHVCASAYIIHESVYIILSSRIKPDIDLKKFLQLGISLRMVSIKVRNFAPKLKIDCSTI